MPKSTAAQRSYIAALARRADPDMVDTAFKRAAAINQNRPKADWETVTQFTNRLTRDAASRLIEDLKEMEDKRETGAQSMTQNFLAASTDEPVDLDAMTAIYD